MSVHKQGQIIDSRCPIQGCELVEHNNKVYSCSLNQTDITTNKNKFYIMQLVKQSNQYYLFTCFGRISESGKAGTKTFTTLSSGISAFEKQFKSKTGNDWHTKQFVKKPNKYFMTEVSYETELKDVKVTDTKIPASKLDPRVQELITMLSDVKMMKNAMVSLDIDTKKLPLGKIKQSQLKLAKEVLDKIEVIISQDDKKNKNNANDLVELTNTFYTFLPMAFGRRKPTLIDTKELVQKYSDTIEELMNIAIAVKIQEGVKADENPIDAVYNKINTTIKALDKSSKMWGIIENYVATTHGPTHGHCKLQLIDIYEVEQHGIKAIYEKNTKDISNKAILIHGSPIQNFLSILSKNFYLDPSKVDSKIAIAGKMFGLGCYWANIFSKSFGYTRSKLSNNIACFILAEIALGNQLKKTQADYYINKKSLDKINCHSTKGVGRYTPSNQIKIDNVIIPQGPIIDTKKQSSLLYDEFIVYDISQILIKYIVVTKNIK